MTEKEKKYDHTPFTLLELNYALSKIDDLVAKHKAGELDEDELIEAVHQAKPSIEDLGIAFNEEEPKTVLNTKPVPENYDSVAYFYTDEDGVPQCTLRVRRYGDNYTPDDEAKIKGAEAMATDLVRMIHNELNNHLMMEVFKEQISELVGENDAASAPDPEKQQAELDALLEGIDDEFTRARVKRDWNNGKGHTKH